MCLDFHSSNPSDVTTMAEAVYLISASFDGDVLSFEANYSEKVFRTSTEIRCLGVAIDSEDLFKRIVLVAYESSDG